MSYSIVMVYFFVLNKGIMVTKNFISIPYPTHAKQGYGLKSYIPIPYPPLPIPTHFPIPNPGSIQTPPQGISGEHQTSLWQAQALS